MINVTRAGTGITALSSAKAWLSSITSPSLFGSAIGFSGNRLWEGGLESWEGLEDFFSCKDLCGEDMVNAL